MSDIVLLWILALLLLLSAFLRVRLAEKKKQPLSTVWKVQAFLFPAAAIFALVCFGLGLHFVAGVVLLGVLEEIVCYFVRRRQQKKTVNK